MSRTCRALWPALPALLALLFATGCDFELPTIPSFDFDIPMGPPPASDIETDAGALPDIPIETGPVSRQVTHFVDGDPPPPPACEPYCAGAQCGPDGCGGICGTCPSAKPVCEAGICENPTPGAVVGPWVSSMGSGPPQHPFKSELFIANPGTAPLIIQSVTIVGHAGFALLGDHGLKLTAGTTQGGAPVDLPPVAPGGRHIFPVTFSSTQTGPATAIVTFETNAGTRHGWLSALVSDDTKGPCMTVSPAVLDFGAIALGTTATRSITLKSCGQDTVSLSQITWGTAPIEGLEFTGGSPPTTPLSLGPGISRTVSLSFTPQTLSDAQDGKLLIKTKSSLGTSLWIPFRVRATDAPCPTAVISGLGDASDGPSAGNVPITLNAFDTATPVSLGRTRWTVRNPAGQAVPIAPSGWSPFVTFTPDAPGNWTANLEVWDADDQAGCESVKTTVPVGPDADLHIVARWTFDGAFAPGQGPDIDLHLSQTADAAAADGNGDGQTDPWYAVPWDCFWFNPNPEWGVPGLVVDDPIMVTEGGPGATTEAIQIDAPRVGETMRIGLHHWGAVGNQPVTADVEIWVHGALFWSARDQAVLPGALWEVADLSWTENGAQITVRKGPGGGAAILGSYKSLSFPSP